MYISSPLFLLMFSEEQVPPFHLTDQAKPVVEIG